MRLDPSALSQQLSKSLSPYYLLFGTESFLIDESARAIREKLLQKSVEKIILSGEKTDPQALMREIAQPSLFAQQRLIEISFSKMGPGQEALLREITENYSTQTDVHTYFLFQASQISQKQQQSAWFKACSTQGLVIHHGPLNESAFKRWMSERARIHGIVLDDTLRERLFYTTQGNCLAAAQEIERMSLYPDEETSHQQSQFQLFDLCDAVFQKRPEQVIKILDYIARTQEIPLLLVIWALTQRLKALSTLSAQVALSRLAQADSALKSGKSAGGFTLILETCLELAGSPLFAEQNFKPLPL